MEITQELQLDQTEERINKMTMIIVSCLTNTKILSRWEHRIQIQYNIMRLNLKYNKETTPVSRMKCRSIYVALLGAVV